MDGSIRVLYVGRHAAAHRADRLRTRRDSFAVEHADTPEDALDTVSRGDVDCVVSEHHPERFDGLAFLSRVRDVDPAVPFVLFAEDGSESVASDAISAGVSDYVPRDDSESCYEELAAACSDAADRYRAEQDVAMLNDLARNVYERITDAFFAVDRDWDFTYLNPEAEALLDLRAEDVIGANIWDTFPDAVGTTFYTEFHRAIATQEAVTFTEYFAPLDKHFEVRAFPSADGLSVHFHRIDPGEVGDRDRTHLLELTNVLSYDLVDSIERAQSAVDAAREGDEDALDDVEVALDRMDDLVNHSITLASNQQS